MAPPPSPLHVLSCLHPALGPEPEQPGSSSYPHSGRPRRRLGLHGGPAAGRPGTGTGDCQETVTRCQGVTRAFLLPVRALLFR